MHRALALILTAVLTGASLIHPANVAAVGIVTLAGAGDIASCHTWRDQKTGNLLDDIPGTVFTLGDNAYPNGTAENFKECYAPAWGRHKSRTWPVPGNHDYHVPGAADYFDYFGSRAGTPGKGWYAYTRGAWRMYALNSNCDDIGGCWIGSRQQTWLARDLRDHPHACVMAYWHHPRFSSGFHGNQRQVRGLFKTLFQAGAELVVNGHDHNYERFAPQDPQANPDPNGIREFVVGTGGANTRPFETIQPNSQVRDATSFGVLKLVLGDGFYRWRFIAGGNSTFTDSGEGTCH